jgi:NarL family two-component system response regulator LiaR
MGPRQPIVLVIENDLCGRTGGGVKMEQIRVLIVDEHEIMRQGLRMALEAAGDLEVAGEAGTALDALQCCADLRPDIVLLDVLAPQIGGVATIHLLCERQPSSRVVVLTHLAEETLVQRTLGAGALGYLLKDISAAGLVEAIRAAHAGRATLAPEAARTLVGGAGQTAQHDPGDDLSERERQVIGLLTRGLTNAEIAVQLGLSRSTVKFHLSNILSKLGVSSRSAAAVFAVQHSLAS